MAEDIRYSFEGIVSTCFPVLKRRKLWPQKNRILFTSESVTEGHPDKIPDQISDAILDACLADDPSSRVAWETLTATGLVVIAGEITTKDYVDFQQIVRDTEQRCISSRAYKSATLSRQWRI